MSRTQLYIFILAFFLLGGCGGFIIHPTESSYPYYTATSSPREPQSSHATTPENSHNGQVISPTYTQSNLPIENQPIIDCLNTSYTINENRIFTGQIILGSVGGDYLLIDLNSYKKTPIQKNNGDIFNLSISPDGSRVAYLICSQANCMVSVISYSGEITTFPYQPDWRIIYWLNHTSLAIIHDSKPINSIIIYDLNSKGKTELTLNLPNPLYITTPSKSTVLITSINSDNTRAIYFDTQGIGRILLWDIEGKKVIAYLPYYINYNSPNISIGSDYLYGWSPDGTQYLTTSPIIATQSETKPPAVEELFVINKNGEIKQLTHLEEKYKFVQIDNYIWSPDGKRIAFWFRTNEVSTSTISAYRLGVIDLSNSQFVDYCLIGGNEQSSIRPPFWAPNSQQLLLRILDHNGQFSPFIVNLLSRKIYQLNESMDPFGWIGKP